jgi:hypothetical protein
MPNWVVTYSQSGCESQIEESWPNRPDLERAASWLVLALSLDVPAVDTIQGAKDPNFQKLEHHDIKIISIEEALAQQ